jgi:hypothetical protein
MGDSHTINDARQVRARARAIRFDFVMPELDLGLTFCRTAHRVNADEAQTVLRAVQALELSDAERELFEQKEQELRWLFGKLQAGFGGNRGATFD